MNGNLSLIEMNRLIGNKEVAESIKVFAGLFPGKIVFTTSFGIEDQVITHIIFENDIPVKVATLDTGRLFPETYRVFNETIKRYQKNIDVYFPDHEDIEKMVTSKGPFSFYYSKENRLECCRIRKVDPLNRALAGMDCWLSGIRADQSDNRSQMNSLEYDDRRKLFKYYPLFDWSYEGVRNFVRENDIPFNTLHNKGYVSIGCEPCTRAVREGGDFRSGRWWWETDGTRECGCHIK